MHSVPDSPHAGPSTGPITPSRRSGGPTGPSADCDSEFLDAADDTTWGFTESSEIAPGYFAWDLLGIGRRFEMWIAWCADRLTPVCVKLPRRDALDPATIDALGRELAAATSCDHPAIPRVFASDLSASVPYVVHEFVEGKPLSAVIDDDGPLPPGEVALVGLQLAAALRHVHSRGYVHLDLKPSNVMLRGDRVTLCDFDIALPVGGQRSRTKPRGTHHYMAPEQIRCEPAQPAMDLFALGALLFEVATGEDAFGVPSRSESSTSGDGRPPYAQLLPERPLVRAVVPDFPLPLAEVIDLLLRLDPADRPTSADDVVRLLEQALGPEDERLWPDWVPASLLHRTAGAAPLRAVR